MVSALLLILFGVLLLFLSALDLPMPLGTAAGLLGVAALAASAVVFVKGARRGDRRG